MLDWSESRISIQEGSTLQGSPQANCVNSPRMLHGTWFPRFFIMCNMQYIHVSFNVLFLRYKTKILDVYELPKNLHKSWSRCIALWWSSKCQVQHMLQNKSCRMPWDYSFFNYIDQYSFCKRQIYSWWFTYESGPILLLYKASAVYLTATKHVNERV